MGHLGTGIIGRVGSEPVGCQRMIAVVDLRPGPNSEVNEVLRGCSFGTLVESIVANLNDDSPRQIEISGSISHFLLTILFSDRLSSS